MHLCRFVLNFNVVIIDVYLCRYDYSGYGQSSGKVIRLLFFTFSLVFFFLNCLVDKKREGKRRKFFFKDSKSHII